MKQLLIIMSNDVLYIYLDSNQGWPMKAYFQWGPYGINNNKY